MAVCALFVYRNSIPSDIYVTAMSINMENMPLCQGARARARARAGIYVYAKGTYAHIRFLLFRRPAQRSRQPAKLEALCFQPPLPVCCKVQLTLLQQPVLLKILGDHDDRLLDTRLLTVNVHLRLLGGLVGRADAGEVLDLAGAGLLVQALGVALLGLFDGDVDEDLDEGEG